MIDMLSQKLTMMGRPFCVLAMVKWGGNPTPEQHFMGLIASAMDLQEILAVTLFLISCYVKLN